jgi:hypothetical protein
MREEFALLIMKYKIVLFLTIRLIKPNLQRTVKMTGIRQVRFIFMNQKILTKSVCNDPLE